MSSLHQDPCSLPSHLSSRAQTAVCLYSSPHFFFQTTFQFPLIFQHNDNGTVYLIDNQKVKLKQCFPVALPCVCVLLISCPAGPGSVSNSLTTSRALFVYWECLLSPTDKAVQLEVFYTEFVTRTPKLHIIKRVF